MPDFLVIYFDRLFEPYHDRKTTGWTEAELNSWAAKRVKQLDSLYPGFRDWFQTPPEQRGR